MPIHKTRNTLYMHIIQQKILKLASTENIAQYGLRKLGERVDVKHPQKVKWHLQKLLKDGHLIRDNFGAIKVVGDDTSPNMARIPILGLANCGEALAFADNTQHGTLTLSPSLVATKNYQNLFAVQATGDSMNKANIKGQPIDDGDYVIVDSTKGVPSTGDCIVSSIEGLANIKKYVRDEVNQVVALVSESTRQRPPIVISDQDIDNYRVHGTVVGVVKSYS